jgi:hypothetical protein
MKTLKEFILDTLLPYKKDKSNCGYDNFNKACEYLTHDGKKCAIGKHMKKGPWQNFNGDASELFEKYDKNNIIKKYSLNQNIDTEGWVLIQSYHDYLPSLECSSSIPYINDIVTNLEKHFKLNLDKLRF